MNVNCRTGGFVLRNEHVGKDGENVLLKVLHFHRQAGYVLKHNPRAE